MSDTMHHKLDAYTAYKVFTRVNYSRLIWECLALPRSLTHGGVVGDFVTSCPPILSIFRYREPMFASLRNVSPCHKSHMPLVTYVMKYCT